MFCNKCGNKLPDGSAFCPVCGNDLRSVMATPVQQMYQPVQPVPQARTQTNVKRRKKNKKKKGMIGLLTGIVVFLILALAGILYFMFFGKDSEYQKSICENTWYIAEGFENIDFTKLGLPEFKIGKEGIQFNNDNTVTIHNKFTGKKEKFKWSLTGGVLKISYDKLTLGGKVLNVNDEELVVETEKERIIFVTREILKEEYPKVYEEVMATSDYVDENTDLNNDDNVASEDSDDYDDMDSEYSLKKIGISFPSDTANGWKMSGRELKDRFTELGYDVVLQYADRDTEKQVNQIDDMISEGCNLLIIDPVEREKSLTDVLKKASSAGIPVISFDVLIMNSDAVSYYVTFDMYQKGYLQGKFIENAYNLTNYQGTLYMEITTGDADDSSAQSIYEGAMSVLKKYIDNGTIVVLSGETDFYDVATPWWSEEEAKERALRIINENYVYGNVIDIWLCSNDSVARGVSEALSSDYPGPYPTVTGMDCDEQNVVNLITGKQAMSAFSSPVTIVDRTVKMADEILNGKSVEVNNTGDYYNNVRIVPTYICDSIIVTSDNYGEVLIESGYYKEGQFR